MSRSLDLSGISSTAYQTREMDGPQCAGAWATASAISDAYEQASIAYRQVQAASSRALPPSSSVPYKRYAWNSAERGNIPEALRMIDLANKNAGESVVSKNERKDLCRKACSVFFEDPVVPSSGGAFLVERYLASFEEAATCAGMAVPRRIYEMAYRISLDGASRWTNRIDFERDIEVAKRFALRAGIDCERDIEQTRQKKWGRVDDGEVNPKSSCGEQFKLRLLGALPSHEVPGKSY